MSLASRAVKACRIKPLGWKYKWYFVSGHHVFCSLSLSLSLLFSSLLFSSLLFFFASPFFPYCLFLFVGRTFSRHCRNIDKLNLANCPKLTDQAIKSIAHHCKLLASLNLSSCMGLTDASCGYLA